MTEQGEPQVGAEIQLRHDALVEVAPSRPGAPTTWQYLAAGSRGRVIGYRDREFPTAVVDVRQTKDTKDKRDRRLVVFVRESSLALA